MIKGSRQFPIKFNHNLYIETKDLQGSSKLKEVLRRVLPIYAQNVEKWCYGDSGVIHYAANQEVIWISVQQKRVHFYYYVTGNHKDYFSRQTGVDSTAYADPGIVMTATKFINLCENKSKEMRKHVCKK